MDTICKKYNYYRADGGGMVIPRSLKTAERSGNGVDAQDVGPGTMVGVRGQKPRVKTLVAFFLRK